jgi:hypothetical protein
MWYKLITSDYTINISVKYSTKGFDSGYRTQIYRLVKKTKWKYSDIKHFFTFLYFHQFMNPSSQQTPYTDEMLWTQSIKIDK